MEKKIEHDPYEVYDRLGIPYPLPLIKSDQLYNSHVKNNFI